MEHTIEFPGLGWSLPISPDIVIPLPGDHQITLHWYGLLIALGFLLAVLYGMKRAKELDIDPDRMIDVTLVATVMGFVGARLYYVFAGNQIEDYLADPIRIFKIWEGGIGIYGGIIFAFLFGILMCRLRKVNVLAMCDLAALGFLIGQSIGRWGNFFNQEAFGGNTTLPWGMTGDIIRSGINGTGYNPNLPVHPTFLYESLWCALGFVLLHLLSKKAYRFKGQIFSGYLVWYGIGRFFIESLRTDSLMLGPIRQSQLAAVLTVIAGVVIFAVLNRRSKQWPLSVEEDTLDLENAEDDPEPEDEEDEETPSVTLVTEESPALVDNTDSFTVEGDEFDTEEEDPEEDEDNGLTD